MKKLVSLLLCLVLTLGAAFAVGCGGDSFSGSYKETTKEEIQQFANEVDAVENAEQLDFSKGMKLDFKMVTDVTGEGSVDMEMNFKSSLNDKDFQMAGEVKMNMKEGENSLESKASVYYKDGKCYANAGNEKVFTTISFDEVLDDYYGEAFGQVLDLEDVIDEFEDYGEDVKYSMDKNDKDVKLKFEFKGKVNEPIMGSITMEMDIDCVAVFVFDAQTKCLTAYKYEAKMNGKTTIAQEGEYAVNADIKMSVQPYEGKIDFPNDLDTYVED